MPELLRILHFGSSGSDVEFAQRLLKKNRTRWSFYDGPIDGRFGEGTKLAVLKAKWRLGYPSARINGRFGEGLQSFLVPADWQAYRRLPLAYRIRLRARLGRGLPDKYRPSLAVSPGYPLGRKGEQIGFPYQGTHSHPYASDPMHNWESCNAVDIGVPEGTPVLAVADGVIGPQFGPLNSSNPVLLGLRLHLRSSDNEFYYAHLHKFASGLGPGDRVHRGSLLGYSGVANGVAHLHLASERGDPGRLIGHPTPGYSDHRYPG